MEGLTEQLFIEKLLTEILGDRNIAIEKSKMQGGSSVAISITVISTPNITNDTGYYFLIIDCGGETTVSSYIREQRESLINTGYVAIFGLLDVRPRWERDEIPELERFLYYGLPQRELETKFILSIMEIEAWFLADENHYKEIDPNLTLDLILMNNNFDPTSNTEVLENPAELLDEIYKNVDLRYGKSRSQISRTVNNLDYENIYFEVQNRIPSLKELIQSIEVHI